MAWGDLASNQMVSFTDIQGGGFTLNSGQSHTTSNQLITKSEATTKYNLDAGSLSSYASNQCVPKSVLLTGVTAFDVDFILDWGFNAYMDDSVNSTMDFIVDVNDGSGYYNIFGETFYAYNFNVENGGVFTSTISNQSLVHVYVGLINDSYDFVSYVDLSVGLALWEQDPEYQDLYTDSTQTTYGPSSSDLIPSVFDLSNYTFLDGTSPANAFTLYAWADFNF